MKFFADYHHHALARFLVMTLSGRLGHEIVFPNDPFSTSVGREIWGIMHEDWYEKVGLSGCPRPKTISEDEFLSTSFDFAIASRTESQRPLLRLLRKHPDRKRIKLLAVSGNASSVFDWSKFQNLICTDFLTSEIASEKTNVHIMPQELGPMYCRGFQPILEEDLHTVSSFIHGIRHWGTEWNYDTVKDRCPHCQTSSGSISDDHPKEHIRIYDLWRKAAYMLPTHSFNAYGHDNQDIGGLFLEEIQIADVIDRSGLTLHLKPSEGFGHSLLQAIRRGRLAVVPKRLYRYKMAGRYLIPGVTSEEVEWRANSITSAILKLTCDLDEANERAYRCYEVSSALFNPAYEATQLKRWLERI